MCDKCRPIDERMARYRRLQSQIDDQQTVDSLVRLVQELEAQKLVLHPIK